MYNNKVTKTQINCNSATNWLWTTKKAVGELS